MATRRTGAVPWLVAGVAGVALAALLLIYFAFLLPDKSNASDRADLTATERSAVTGAQMRALNLVSFRVAHFDADWARAVAGTTGTLRKELDTAAQKSSTQKMLAAAKSDASATIDHASLEGPAGKGGGYVVLVSLDGFHTNAKTQTVPTDLELTVVPKGKTWLVSDVQSLDGVSS
ncbi:hypothetical protein [uncultured Jatrophihabitans sp.]|uniref:hypothetical protein n=1 Tax=uncultured Jatrophihabitans sp. TaxID=1610747 RepID=UPI0035CB6039